MKVQKRHLVAELNLKMSLFAYLTFSISALPPGGVFPLWRHFFLLLTLGKKSVIQIFDTSWLDRSSRQNVTNEWFWVSCISGTLNLPQKSNRITFIFFNLFPVKPSFATPPPAELSRDYGSVVNIACQAVGVPAPNIVWYRNAIPINRLGDSR